MYTKDKGTIIVKCGCGNKLPPKKRYFISTSLGQYFKECNICGALNYRFFPSYINPLQYKKFLKVLNEM